MAVEVPGAHQNLTNDRQDLSNYPPTGWLYPPKIRSTRARFGLNISSVVHIRSPKDPSKYASKKGQTAACQPFLLLIWPLQCHLTLFLYHLIQDYNLSFARSQLSIQSISVPNGTKDGHAHVHILNTVERHDGSPNGIFYIVKYNFKDEPSFRVGQSDSYEKLFHARVVSSVEAIAKIFSFHFHGCDSTLGYISLRPPETQSAAFISGVKVQVPAIQRYLSS